MFIISTDWIYYTIFLSHNITNFQIKKHETVIQNDLVTRQPLTLQNNMKVSECSKENIRHKSALNIKLPPLWKELGQNYQKKGLLEVVSL